MTNKFHCRPRPSNNSVAAAIFAVIFGLLPALSSHADFLAQPLAASYLSLYPYNMVGILRVATANGNLYSCSASVVKAPRVGLTASHCFYDLTAAVHSYATTDNGWARGWHSSSAPQNSDLTTLPSYWYFSWTT